MAKRRQKLVCLVNGLKQTGLYVHSLDLYLTLLVAILAQMEQVYKYMVITVQQRKSFGFILLTLEMLICGLEQLSIPYPKLINYIVQMHGILLLCLGSFAYML